MSPLTELRPPLKKSWFPVQRVAEIMAIRAAAISFFFFFFFFLVREKQNFFGKKKNRKLNKKFPIFSKGGLKAFSLLQ